MDERAHPCPRAQVVQCAMAPGSGKHRSTRLTGDLKHFRRSMRTPCFESEWRAKSVCAKAGEKFADVGRGVCVWRSRSMTGTGRAAHRIRSIGYRATCWQELAWCAFRFNQPSALVLHHLGFGLLYSDVLYAMLHSDTLEAGSVCAASSSARVLSASSCAQAESAKRGQAKLQGVNRTSLASYAHGVATQAVAGPRDVGNDVLSLTLGGARVDVGARVRSGQQVSWLRARMCREAAMLTRCSVCRRKASYPRPQVSFPKGHWGPHRGWVVARRECGHLLRSCTTLSHDAPRDVTWHPWASYRAWYS